MPLGLILSTPMSIVCGTLINQVSETLMMPTIAENLVKIFAAGTARLKMTGLTTLNGSDEHLAFANFLKVYHKLTPVQQV